MREAAASGKRQGETTRLELSLRGSTADMHSLCMRELPNPLSEAHCVGQGLVNLNRVCAQRALTAEAHRGAAAQAVGACSSPFSEMASVSQALALTMLGAAGTALGGLLVVLQPRMSLARLGALQGLAAGLMLSISIMDLLPEAAEEIGLVAANVCFYAGVAFFAAVVALIPEPHGWMAPSPAAAAAKKQQKQKQAAAAGAAGVAGGSSSSVRSTPALSRTASTGEQAAAAGLLQQQQQLALPQPSPRSPSAASTASADLDVMLLDDQQAGPDTGSKDESRKLKRQLLMSGLITAIGIALHNFPEGVAVFLAAHKSPAVGVSLALAIALHNIPEGVAVALPVYCATGSRLKGLQTAVASGLAEPLAVVLLGLLFPVQLDKSLVDGMLASVGGIMAFLAFHELLPLAVQHAGKGVAVGCLFGGMALMSANLHLLNTYVLAGLH